MPDIPGDQTTTEVIAVGGTVTNSLETVGDRDWFRIELSGGQEIRIDLAGIGTTPVEDTYLRVYDSAGNLLFENDDIVLGSVRDSSLAFQVPSTGTYYIEVGAWNDGYAGEYQLSVSNYVLPPEWDYNEIAEQLISGYWAGDSHKFNATQGGSITVNITGLTAEGQYLAREALALWSDVIGIAFTEVTTGGQITFDDDEEGAFADASWSAGITSTAEINISIDWLADYGTGLNSYSFQTYIHEIGHALGLGHAGNYNETASYPYDVLYRNDAWPTSVMSYFSQTENTFYSAQGFDFAYVVTPMIADIAAMSMLYGLSTTTRTGDTTYGFNSNAGRDIFNASLYPDVAYTVYDSGGTDTLDYSAFTAVQLINLNPETFSNVGGLTGNVSIGRGVTIENAFGGMGRDTIIANAANNVMRGGTGEDRVSYETATAGVQVDLRLTTQQNTVGAGLDTLSGFENLVGSAFADTLVGSDSTREVRGGAGNDRITGTGLGGYSLYGEDGDDTFVAGSGDDWLSGGAGFDTVDYSAASGAVNVATDVANNITGSSGTDTLSGVEMLIGSAFNDTLWAFSAGHGAVGGAGNDTLKGSGFGASELSGGTGDDTYIVAHSANQVVEAAGEGTDQVNSSATFALGANVENLTLTGTAAINGTGNALGNQIDGNNSANQLSGMDGNDQLYGFDGNDILDGGEGNDIVSGGGGIDRASYATALAGVTVTLASLAAQDTGGAGIDTLSSIENLSGSQFGDRLTGNTLANTLLGLSGDDFLDGGAGGDAMFGGLGDDRYVIDSAGDVASENAGEGIDGVLSPFDYELGAHLENLTLTAAAAIRGTGNALANTIAGNSSDNKLYGLEDGDRLYGEAGDDLLDGGLGGDAMYGGTGNDYFIVDSGSDVTVEAAGEGTDHVLASVTHTLQANVERLTLTGTDGIKGIGNALANVITGNSGENKLYGEGDADRLYGEAGDDLLDGGLSADRMYGGLGNDYYVVDSSNDKTIETAGEGTDHVLSSVDHALQANMERLTLTGTDGTKGIGNALANVITGNSGENKLYGEGESDRLFGEAGDDLLDGGLSADRLYGGLGNDYYIVDSSNDKTIEFAGEGTDHVLSSITHALQANMERLTLTGSDGVKGIGNELANIVTGNSGENKLYGLDGNDRLYGEGGDDLLDGGLGVDRMYGGLGNDYYVVDSNDDFVFEAAGEGTDHVLASVTHTLGDNVERLTLTGTAAIDGTGNGLANELTGNDGANALSGLGGDDDLFGAGGNDTLDGGEGGDVLWGGAGADNHIGGSGSDLFVFDDGMFGGADMASADIIQDFADADGDRIHLTYVDADSTLGGDQGFAFVGTAAFTGTAGELRYEQVDGNTFVSGDTDGDGAADFMIRLDGLHTLGADDFYF